MTILLLALALALFLLSAPLVSLVLLWRPARGLRDAALRREWERETAVSISAGGTVLVHVTLAELRALGSLEGPGGGWTLRADGLSVRLRLPRALRRGPGRLRPLDGVPGLEVASAAD